MAFSNTRQTYAVSSWLFARVLGGVLLIAFVSLGVQAKGLFGSAGVMPISMLVEQARAAGHSFWQHPSALWWGSGDTMIAAVWVVGMVAALALLLGLVPKLALAVSWFAYLSFVSLGWPFMSFQWDVLLLEASFTAFFFVPLRLWDRPSGHPAPHPIARWALWWLLFRLMFRSAWVKIASGDAAWADLSALSYHYWTQPLPTSLAWYANLLPEWVQTVSCALMFAVELGAPVLLLLPWAWARRTAAVAIVALMILIALTGNYGFFNLCTIALCIPLLDDRLLTRFARGRFDATPAPDRKTKWNVWPGVAPALAIVLSGAIFASGTFGRGAPRWLAPIYPFSTFNNYGLFAVMTTERPEIVIEGTIDGQDWKPYGFRYKPGPLDRAPVWNSPHQPRLDWQMWFAALGDYRRNVWLGNLMRRLLQGEPTVLQASRGESVRTRTAEADSRRRLSLRIHRLGRTKSHGPLVEARDRALYAPILGVEIEAPSTPSTAE